MSSLSLKDVATQASQRGNVFDLPSIIVWHVASMGLRGRGSSDE